MAIIGFVALLAFMLYLTVFTGLVLLNCSGPFNIGGASNSWLVRSASWIMLFGVTCLWYELFLNAPFIITLK